MFKQFKIVSPTVMFAIFLIAFSIAPAASYADWEGQIISEKPLGQAYRIGWTDEKGKFFVPFDGEEQFGLINLNIVVQGTILIETNLQNYEFDGDLSLNVMSFQCFNEIIVAEYNQGTVLTLPVSEEETVTVSLTGLHRIGVFEVGEILGGSMQGRLTFPLLTAAFPPALCSGDE
jgi:hypothetical protein